MEGKGMNKEQEGGKKQIKKENNQSTYPGRHIQYITYFTLRGFKPQIPEATN